MAKSKMGEAAVTEESPRTLLALAQHTLSMSGVELAKALNVSKRTIIRWNKSDASMSPAHFGELAQRVHARDPALAERLHACAARWLERHRLPPPAPLPVPAPAPAPPPPQADPAARAESVVYAACEAADASPRAMKPALFAALQRARALGLSLDDLLDALAPQAKGKRQ